MVSHARHHRLNLFLDREGTLLIEHLSRGHLEAVELEQDLRLPPLMPLSIMWSAVRVENLDEMARARVRAAAEERGWDLTEVDKLEPPPDPRPEPAAAEESGPGSSTVDALHSHTLAPSAREKVVVPLILLGALAVLAGIGYVVWDHTNHDYRRARSVSDLLVLATHPTASQGVMASLLEPDDSRFVSLDVTGWQAWVGDAAVTDNTLMRVPTLDMTMEGLVKGDRGSARMVFQFDLSRTDGHTLIAERIVRGGITLPYRDTPVAFLPVPVGELPKVSSTGDGESYAADGDIRHDQEATFQGKTRIAAGGFLEEGDGGVRLVNRNYRVALGPVAGPALAEVIQELKLTPEESRVMEAYIQGKGKFNLPSGKRIQAFITLERTFDWGKASAPGRRQSAREIGSARVDGIQVAQVYVKNAP